MLSASFHFSRHGYRVQGSKTGHVIGTGHKFGRLFESTSFYLPNLICPPPSWQLHHSHRCISSTITDSYIKNLDGSTISHGRLDYLDVGN